MPALGTALLMVEIRWEDEGSLPQNQVCSQRREIHTWTQGKVGSPWWGVDVPWGPPRLRLLPLLLLTPQLPERVKPH